MEELPDAIMVNILSRLSLKALFQCIRVCTTWRNIVLHDPYFANLHLTRANQVDLPCLVLDTSSFSDKPSKLCLIDFNFNDSEDHTLDMISTDPIGIHFNLGFDFGTILSCNGLLCLCEIQTNNPICVCNPVTGDYVTLPQSAQDMNRCHYISGFSFDSINNEYKVIRMKYKIVKNGLDMQPEVEVYTLGSDVWRSIESAPYLLIPHVKIFSRPVNVNGILHWMTRRLCRRDYPELIVAWDVRDEKFRVVPQPVEFSPSMVCSCMQLIVYNKCLTIFNFDRFDFKRNKIWIMKDYNVKESWTKKVENQFLFMNKEVRIRKWYGRRDSSDGEMVLKVVYSVQERRFVKVESEGNASVLYTVNLLMDTHVGSFISVKRRN